MKPENSTDYFSLNVDDLKLSENSGYLFFHKRGHPLAGKKNGIVAVHRHIMSVHIGRWLTPNEVVIFKNRNPQDVRVENLELITRAELSKRTSNRPQQVELVCPHCNNLFKESPSHAIRRRYCSPECAKEAKQKFDVSPKELEQLVWEMPTIKVAEIFDVSDKAIEKRCKKYGINKPPPGYWAKLYSGQIDPTVIEEQESNPFEK